MQRKQLKTPRLCLTLALAVYLCLSAVPATEGFMTYDHFNPTVRRKMNNLIRRVHKEQWVIGYRYADNCPPKSRKNGQAIEEAITQSLNAWLKPVRELNTGQPVVADFRYVPNLVFPVPDAELLLYDLAIEFYCDIDESSALVIADDAIPPLIKMHRGTVVTPAFAFALLHEIGHCFGLLDTYLRPVLGEEFGVSRGGIAQTMGHQPASVMSAHISLSPSTLISQDDANGIVWLYKFYHENLPLEDCIFPDYELEKSPDGCRPKYPLIFEIKHGKEWYAIRVIDDDKNTDINAKDGNGMTALQYAVIKAYPQLVDRLLAHEDIEVNSQDGSGLTALYYAVEKGNPELLDKLLSHENIDVNNQDANGLTPLHHAVKQRNRVGVEKLLAHDNIDIEVKDKDGLTPLDLANQLEYQELADLISPPIEPEPMPVRPQNKLATVWGALKAR